MCLVSNNSRLPRNPSIIGNGTDILLHTTLAICQFHNDVYEKGLSDVQFIPSSSIVERRD